MPGLTYPCQTVTSLADSGPGSLRNAINCATPGDAISFAVAGIIPVVSGPLIINKSLEIRGPGADQLTLSGGGSNRIFDVSSGNVTISRLTIAQGSDAKAALGGGGAVRNTATLVLRECVVTGSQARLAGGGIYNAQGGSISLERCLISGNSVFQGDAGQGGGIGNYGTLSMTNSTVSCL